MSRVTARHDASHEPRGALLLVLAGAAIGAALGMLARAALASQRDGVRFGEALGASLGTNWLDPAVLPWSGGGFALGFLVTGLAVRNRLTVLGLRLVLRSLRIAVGTALGLAFGATAYVVYHGASGLPGSPGPALREAFLRPDAPAGPAVLFLAAGLAAGGFVGLFWALRGQGRRGARLVAGGLLGAVAGLVIFAVGSVVAHGDATGPEDFAYQMAEAVFAASLAELVFVGSAALGGMLLSKYSWQLYGVLTFISLLFVVVGYTTYSLTTTLPQVPADRRWLSLILFGAESLSLLMVVLYSFYTIDVAARKHWRRDPKEVAFSSYYLPKVAFHVPCYNEPADLVKSTLQTLLDMDYPQDRYVVMVCDDSTKEASSAPIAEFCRKNGIFYLHRNDRRGYKAGALNDLLAHTPEDANLLAVIDADYQVEPDFLRETVGFFVDPEMGWIQSPQDYSNRHESFLTEQYYLADAYFYRTVLPSRNEENSIIFCGTMGILRRRALDQVGGWGEKYITEDAELSVRLLNTGWKSLYVNKTYGRGLIPATFEGYQKQHYRWSFGGGKIMRGHFLRLMFGRFTFRQRLDYMVGTLNWFEGAFIFTISLVLLGMGIGELAGAEVLTHHRQEVLLVGLVPLFLMVDGLTRVHLVMRRTIALGFGGTLRILGMWFSVKFSDMRAAFKALLGFSIPFARTSKRVEEGLGRGAALRRAVRLTRLESALAALMLLASLGLAVKLLLTLDGPRTRTVGLGLMSFWLLFYTLAYSAAPLYAYKSLVTVRAPRATVADTAPKKAST